MSAGAPGPGCGSPPKPARLSLRPQQEREAAARRSPHSLQPGKGRVEQRRPSTTENRELTKINIKKRVQVNLSTPPKESYSLTEQTCGYQGSGRGITWEAGIDHTPLCVKHATENLQHRTENSALYSLRACVRKESKKSGDLCVYNRFTWMYT